MLQYNSNQICSTLPSIFVKEHILTEVHGLNMFWGLPLVAHVVFASCPRLHLHRETDDAKEQVSKKHHANRNT